jgi:5-methylcytosine-specific restriction protein A
MVRRARSTEPRLVKQDRDRRHDAKRRAEKPWRRLYATQQWKWLRLQQLTRQPLCERCLDKQPQRYVPATVVHHRRKHEGNAELFFDPANLGSVCKTCHDGEIHSEEMIGFSKAVASDGWPADPKHPANSGRVPKNS